MTRPARLRGWAARFPHGSSVALPRPGRPRHAQKLPAPAIATATATAGRRRAKRRRLRRLGAIYLGGAGEARGQAWQGRGVWGRGRRRRRVRHVPAGHARGRPHAPLGCDFGGQPPQRRPRLSFERLVRQVLQREVFMGGRWGRQQDARAHTRARGASLHIHVIRARGRAQKLQPMPCLWHGTGRLAGVGKPH